MYALEKCSNEKVLLELLKQKPDLNIKDQEYKTAVMYALEKCSNEKVLLEILKYKPDLNIQDKDVCNIILIHAFRYCSNKEVLLELLKQTNDFKNQDYSNKIALMYAFIYYSKKPEFEFNVLEKLYDQSSCENREKFNSEYIKLRNKHKIFPLILFRQSKKKSI